MLKLGPVEAVPWHYHSVVADIFIAVEGRVVVGTRAPAAAGRNPPHGIW
ncbi:MAG TPA: hypothetical protein VKN76_06885 [Kiloniellaceae bacterium]|nr:hypothetical protein [Kiloniellaceae bacterium]